MSTDSVDDSWLQVTARLIDSDRDSVTRRQLACFKQAKLTYRNCFRRQASPADPAGAELADPAGARLGV